MEIELKVEQNKQPRCVKLRLSANLPHDFAGTVDYNRRDVWYKDDASAESLQRVFEYDIVYNSPNGSRLIGIYCAVRNSTVLEHYASPLFLNRHIQSSQIKCWTHPASESGQNTTEIFFYFFLPVEPADFPPRAVTPHSSSRG